MPIITSSDNPQLSLNGDTSLLNSLDDDESFVVLGLERSTTNDLDQGINVDYPSQSFQPQALPNCSISVLNNQTLCASTASQTPSQVITLAELGLPFDNSNISVSVDDIDKRLQEVLHENINLKENLYQTNLAMKQQLSTVRLLQERAVDVQKNQQAKFEETKALILKLESEKNKLLETNTLIIGDLNRLKEENKELCEANIIIGAEEPKLKEEIKELKQANVAFAAEATKLLTENAELKKELSFLQETIQTSTDNNRKASLQLVTENAELKKELSILQENAQTVSENNRKASLQPTTKEIELHEIVDQLTRKLEVVERARRQQEFDIDRLQAQLGRAVQELNDAQRKLAHAENALEATKQINGNTMDLGERTLKYDDLLQQLQATIQEEQTRFNSLHSFLSLSNPEGNSTQFEISELRRLLAEEQTQSVARKENLSKAIATIHELLNDYKKLAEDLERVKADYAVKESHGLAYDAMQKKGFTERIDVLTAKLVEKEEALAISERHFASLQEAVRLQNAEKKDDDEVRALKEQVRTLTNQLTVKEDTIKVNMEEIKSLTTELQHNRSTKETIEVLEEQAKIFQADFEVERKAREALVAEKNRLMEDFRHLQRRNKELIDEITMSRNGATIASAPQPDEVIRNTPSVNSEGFTSVANPRKNHNFAIGTNTRIFHEKQEGSLCAQHCLNALLQGPHFNAVDLAELAQEMDFAENERLREGGVTNKDQISLQKESQNMDDTGFFSVQVIACALELWNLSMISYNSADLRAVNARKNPCQVKAYICNSREHWFTIRRIGGQWFNLNSLLDEPQEISDFSLKVLLSYYQEEGTSVFVVLGDLPPCPADELLVEQNNQGQTMLENSSKQCTEDGLEQMIPCTHPILQHPVDQHSCWSCTSFQHYKISFHLSSRS